MISCQRRSNVGGLQPNVNGERKSNIFDEIAIPKFDPYKEKLARRGDIDVVAVGRKVTYIAPF